jgi:hypothetical protein
VATGVEWKQREAAKGTAGRTGANARDANLAESAIRELKAMIKYIIDGLSDYRNCVYATAWEIR